MAADKIEILGGTVDITSGVIEVGEFGGSSFIQRGGTFAPGPDTARSTILGNFTQASNASLALEIGGTTAGETFDHVAVEGNALLDGELLIDLVNGFSPSSTDTFSVFGAELLFGVFDNVLAGQRLETLDGRGSFVVNYGAESGFDANRIVLSDYEMHEVVLGDFNEDGILSGADMDLLSAASGGTDVVFDLTSDGVVDQADREFWVEDVSRTFFGDTNLDQTVEFQDFLDLAKSFGTNAGWSGGDFDGDGEVAFADFLVLANNFGQTSSGMTSAATVPEPSSGLLGLFVLLGAMWLPRRS